MSRVFFELYNPPSDIMLRFGELDPIDKLYSVGEFLTDLYPL